MYIEPRVLVKQSMNPDVCGAKQTTHTMSQPRARYGLREAARHKALSQIYRSLDPSLLDCGSHCFSELLLSSSFFLL